MFTRTVSGGFVCLRCQLQRSRPLYATRTLTTTSRLQTSRDGTESIATENAIRQQILTGFQDNERSHSSEREIPPKKKTNRLPKPAKLDTYRSRGHKVSMQGEALGIGILGRPAEAIVMKDQGQIHRRQFPVVVEPAGALAQQVDTFDSLEQESTSVTPEEVQENIEGLRPVDSDILPAIEYKTLGETLLNGFTTSQLNQYVEKNIRDFHPEPETALPDAPWIKRKLAWTPQTAEGDQSVASHLRGYISSAMSPKEKLVIRLMRECWGLSMQELAAGVGQLDVQLRELEFALLLVGAQRWLQSIARMYLDQGTRIELFQDSNTIRIVAPRATAETVMSEINSRLRNATTKTFQVSDITSEAIPPAGLQAVGSITNSHVRLINAGKEVEVTWIQTESTDAAIEDVRDMAFRLLATAYRKSTTSTAMHVINGSKEGQFIQDHDNSSKWAWKNRLSKWARWAQPTPVLWTSDKGHTIPPAVLKWHLQKPSTTEATSPHYGWPTQLTTSTTATFGHILHKQPQSGTLLSKLTAKPERILSPVIPPFADIALSSAQPEQDEGLRAIIVMRFIPLRSSFRSTAANVPPNLELRLDATDTESLNVLSLRATTATHAVDILRPDSSIDVRLTQTRFAELVGRDAICAGAGPAVDEFLGHSHLRLSEGNLETPAHLAPMRIPGLLFLAERSGNEGVVADQECVDVEYMFAGLEIHRSVEIDFHSCRLQYNSIEAGQGGGRRAELTIETRPSDGDVGANASGVELFLGDILKVVESNEIRWIGENWKEK